MKRRVVLASILLLALASGLVLDGDVPALEFIADSSGDILWVSMNACSVEPCGFAFRVLVRCVPGALTCTMPEE